ncbi:MAG TPA: PA2169 family four-helix-bundle protein [Puia sp.]|nr:PA2169 family four-helix-bundle protein [Puia sp.]
MENTRDTIEVLNDLIQINNDRIIGYEKAIRETKPADTDLKILYASMIAESHRMKIALATEVQTLGAEIEQGPTTSGKIYRTWMEVKTLFTGNSRHVVLRNCEHNEESAQRAYRVALNHDLPSYIHQLLTRQQETLKASLEEIRSVKEQYV